MKLFLNITGYLVLSIFTLALFLHTFSDAIHYDGLLVTTVLFLIIVGLAYQVAVELANYIKLKLWNFNFKKADLYNFFAVIAGAFATYALSTHLQLGPVVAAGLVGLLAALFKPSCAVAAYCGAFVGMACPCYIFSHTVLLAASLAAGIIYVISGPVFNGFGGKLGTIAFAGCIIAGSALGCSLQSSAEIPWDARHLILGYSVAAAVVTYFLSIRLKHGPVLASSLVGLTGGLILPAIYPYTGNTLGIVAICSSFAGMSSRQRFHKTYLMTIAGLFSGIVFMFSLPYMGGAGGKLGTIAFGSVVALRGLIDLSVKTKTAFTGMSSRISGR